jgi:hypothetical protein
VESSGHLYNRCEDRISAVGSDREKRPRDENCTNMPKFENVALSMFCMDFPTLPCDWYSVNSGVEQSENSVEQLGFQWRRYIGARKSS